MCYFNSLLDPKERKNKLAMLVKVARELNPAFVVGRGVSGSFGLLVANELNIPYVVVRKGESTHSHATVECTYFGERKTYVIVDDFVETGNTIEIIRREIDDLFECFGDCAQLLAVLFYQPSPHYKRFDPDFDFYYPTYENKYVKNVK